MPQGARSRRTLFVLSWLAVVPLATAVAQEDASPSRIFRYEAPIQLPAEMARVPIPAEVLSRCRSGLEDLRVFDSEGNEVPHAIASIPPRAAGTETRLVVTPEGVDRRTDAADPGPPIARERYVLPVPPAVTNDRLWSLEIESAVPAFVRRVVVGRGASGDAAAIESSVYRMESPRRERRAIALPAGTSGPLEVSFEGEGAFLEPTFTFVSIETEATPSHELRVPLAVITRERRAGKTILLLRRPRGIEPTALDVRADASIFLRSIVIRDEGPLAAGRALHTVVRRTPEGPDLVSVDVPAFDGDRIVVEIDDGDEPPLEGLAIVAVVRAPELVLHPEPAHYDLTLRFGGRVGAPRYPVSPLLASADFASLPTGWMGEIRESTTFSNEPALADVMKPGRALDARGHRWSFVVEAPSSREGLVRVPLSAEVFASARDDLGDLRVVDANGAQWPFLLVPSSAPLSFAANVARFDDGSAPRGTSRYAITVSPAPIPVVAFALEVRDTFVRRDYEFVTRFAERTVDQGSGVFVLAPGFSERSFSVSLSGLPIDSITLDVRDGDENPLRIAGVGLSVRATDLYLVAPEGRYALLAGAPDLAAPVYDLQRARGLVLVAEHEDASLGPRQDNARFEPPSAWSASRASDYAVWIAVIVAVLFLGALTFRLVREEPRSGTG